MDALAKVFRNKQCRGRVRLSSIFWLASSALPHRLPDMLPRSVGRLTRTFHFQSPYLSRVDRAIDLVHLFPEMADSLAHGFRGGDRVPAGDIMTPQPCRLDLRRSVPRVSPAHIQMGERVLIQSAGGAQLFMRLKGANRAPCAEIHCSCRPTGFIPGEIQFFLSGANDAGRDSDLFGCGLNLGVHLPLRYCGSRRSWFRLRCGRRLLCNQRPSKSKRED